LLEKAVQTKFKHGYEKETNIQIPLPNPHTVNPIISPADKSEVPATLCKIIDDIDVDRRKGKQLATKIIQSSNNPFLQDTEKSQQSYPCTTRRMTHTPSKVVHRDEQGSIEDEEGLEGHKLENAILEHRALTIPEIQQYRLEYTQKGEKDVTYLEQVWSSGADSLELLGNEKKQLSGIIENAHIYEVLLAAMEVRPKAVMSLFRWLSEAWCVVIKELDFSTLKVDVSWKNLDDAIKLARKLGIRYIIMNT
jgi:hypothetical protein